MDDRYALTMDDEKIFLAEGIFDAWREAQGLRRAGPYSEGT